jgi:hypothetical protein
LIDLDGLETEDLACLGLHRADNEWSFGAIEREIDPDADYRLLKAFIASSAPPKRRIRRPSLESTVRQMLKAAQAAGVTIAVTIEGEAGKVTATPVKGAAVAAADSDFNEWDRDLGTHPPEVRQ